MNKPREIIDPLPSGVMEAIDAYGRYYAEHHKLGMSFRDDKDEQVRPLNPTKEMIEAGAQRLVRWETGNEKWPDAWSALDVRASRNDAERVWRSMWLAAPVPECGTLSGATPRTDALYERMPRTFNNSADAFWCREMGDHARQLERELAEHRDNGRRLMEAADGWKAEAERLRGVERALERANEEIASRSAIGNTSK